MLEWIGSGLVLGFLALTWKVWTYRLAIIQLQADMTLVLNELTRPPLRESIHCNRCHTTMSPDEYAFHACERLTERAQVMQTAKQHCYDAR